MKSVVIVTSTFRIPRKDPDTEDRGDRGMDYVGPLNGPSIRCRIPSQPPAGDQQTALCVRNWRNMRGRPKRALTPLPSRKKVEGLLSPEAFLAKYSRQSLATYGGRTRSAERLVQNSCPALMRGQEQGETSGSFPTANTQIGQRPGPTEEDLRKLNERLLRMAGLEPQWDAGQRTVVTLRPSSSVPDLNEEIDQQTIEIGAELTELVQSRKHRDAYNHAERAKANEAELRKLTA